MCRKALLFLALLVLLAGCGPASAPTVVPTATPLPPTATATPSPTATPTPTPTPVPDTWTRPADGMVMVRVRAGIYPIGSTEPEINTAYAQCQERYQAGQCNRVWFEDELPHHTLSLEMFWIDRTEVTFGQYQACVEAGVCTASSAAGNPDLNGPQQPVVGVAWRDAQAYCAWVGARLPTEAEWEAAAGGPQGFLYPWGDSFDGSQANSCDAGCPNAWSDPDYDDGYARTAPVGAYPSAASWCGALDLAGNVWEWTSSLVWPYPYQADDGREDPQAAGDRIMRGGSWYDYPWYMRSTERIGTVPTWTYDFVGFRCAVSSVSP